MPFLAILNLWFGTREEALLFPFDSSIKRLWSTVSCAHRIYALPGLTRTCRYNEIRKQCHRITKRKTGIRVNASKHEEKSEKDKSKMRSRARRIYSMREELTRRGKRTYEQKRLIRCRRIEEGSGSDLADLRALDKKESALEVQAILLRKLATEENYLKGLGGIPSPSYTPFERRLKEVEEAIRLGREPS